MYCIIYYYIYFPYLHQFSSLPDGQVVRRLPQTVVFLKTSHAVRTRSCGNGDSFLQFHQKKKELWELVAQIFPIQRDHHSLVTQHSLACKWRSFSDNWYIYTSVIKGQGPEGRVQPRYLVVTLRTVHRIFN